jgi:rhomboid-like protein
MVGASGALFGVLAAFAMLFPNTELYLMFIPFPVKAKYLIGGYFILEVFLGFGKIQGDSVAHFAHVGGAIVGFILVKMWQRNKTTFY